MKNSIKKILALLLALAFALSLTACQDIQTILSEREERKPAAEVTDQPDEDDEEERERDAVCSDAELFRQPGNTVLFGAYEQDGNEENGAEPVEWLVLAYDAETDCALLISRYALDAEPYNRNNWSGITWSFCSLREWLNDDFIAAAFLEKEQQALTGTKLENEDNEEYDTYGGNDTLDRVFLLSEDEAELYFAGDAERKCSPTLYAASRELETVTEADGTVRCDWWLRSPGSMSTYAADVLSDGTVYTRGDFVDGRHKGVRPVLRVNVSLLPAEDDAAAPER